MAEIPGIRIFWELSPRLVFFPNGVSDVSIQDLWDTLRAEEAKILQADDISIIEGSGKVGLSGGLFTGIVLILRNARVGFDYHPLANGIGTITGVTYRGDTTEVEDLAATFISDGVQIGDAFVNASAIGSTSIIEVQSETKLRVLMMSSSTRSPDQMEVGDSYSLFPNVDASVSGGDLVSLEVEGSPESVNLEPIFPVPFVNATIFQSTQAALLDAGITEAGLANAVWTETLEQYIDQESAARDVLLNQVFQSGKRSTDPDTGIITIRKTLPSGRIFTMTGAIWEDIAETIPYRGGGIEVQEELVETSP